MAINQLPRITGRPNVMMNRVEECKNYSMRPKVRGKFIYIADEKYWIRGVTYGTFCPNEEGNQFPDAKTVDRDFSAIAENNMNTVRTYTVPPLWLLDIAQKHGLRVMVGIPWEQHITFLDNRKIVKSIKDRMSKAVKSLEKHPAVLCYTIGNEIPASIVRWYGRLRIEKFLKCLYKIAKSEDPEALVTYVNFPTTEFLQLPFLDFISFNVYLESQEMLEAYLARLQNISEELPLVMAEIGLDSRRNGLDVQGSSIDWQVRTVFAYGCAGAIVFAWTDEWYRGGHDIEDWDFGLTTRDRQPKPALTTISKAFSEAPFSAEISWPSISVILCVYNGARTIRKTFEGFKKLDYPNYEVIVINDGSTDDTAKIASEYDVQLINTENKGLSRARNTGFQAAKGEIVAYIDADAYPDPQWLKYLAFTFMNNSFVGVGGSNIIPTESGCFEDCVDNSPGNPNHVLISDQEAEHIPGCNMAFRKTALEAVGGFDPTFSIAGDDVDICWKLQEKGWKIGFNGSALVWHHCRNSIKAYWRQQYNYGKAEAALEQNWPEKYNSVGHVPWTGRVYCKGTTQPLVGGRQRIYSGKWGSALFQSLYESKPGTIFSLLLMPEWYLIVAYLFGLSLIGILWKPLLFVLPLAVTSLIVPVLQAMFNAKNASFSTSNLSVIQQIKMRVMTCYLHLLQPAARLSGRISCGLVPFRFRMVSRYFLPWRRKASIWSETWHGPEEYLKFIVDAVKKQNAVSINGDDFNSWDLKVRGGAFGSIYLQIAIEEHGSGQQFIRFKTWPHCSPFASVTTIVFGVLSLCAAMDNAWNVLTILGLFTLSSIFCILHDCGRATTITYKAFKMLDGLDEKKN
ncbi:MAG: glycosyltransferase [Planctomycetota bacterium]|jgi:glycosyltransferase involved in cell wall biosynthesis